MRTLLLASAALALLAGPAFAQTTVVTTTNDPTVVTTTEPSSNGERAAGTLAGTGTGAVAGALVGGPVGAVVGGVAGTIIGGAASAPDDVRQYVVTNPTAPVIVEGEIVDGYSVPETVTLAPIPSNPDYGYFYADGNRPVIVNSSDRRVVYYDAQ